MNVELLHKYFDKCVTKTFEEALKEMPRRLKLKSCENTIRKEYKIWREIYMTTSGRVEMMTLEDFAYLKASRSSTFISAEDIQVAVMMKKRKATTKEIVEITCISKAKLQNLFADAYLKGVLDDTEYKLKTRRVC